MIRRCPALASAVPARDLSSVNDRAVLAAKMSNHPPMCSAGTVTCSARSSTDRSCQNWSRRGWLSSSDHQGHTFSSTGWRLGGSASRCGCGSASMALRSASSCGSPAPRPSWRSASASAICVDHDWIECQDRAPPSEYHGVV
jgi:hypothetical protein